MGLFVIWQKVSLGCWVGLVLLPFKFPVGMLFSVFVAWRVP